MRIQRDWVNGVHHCKRCKRRMYRKNPDGKGEAQYGKDGECTACLKRRTYKPKRDGDRRAPALDWSKPVHCLGCKRPLRPAKVPAALKPGTLSLKAEGRCTVCLEKARAGRDEAFPVAAPTPELSAYLSRRRERLARRARVMAA